jgi:hypothetical protein
LLNLFLTLLPLTSVPSRLLAYSLLLHPALVSSSAAATALCSIATADKHQAVSVLTFLSKDFLPSLPHPSQATARLAETLASSLLPGLITTYLDVTPPSSFPPRTVLTQLCVFTSARVLALTPASPVPERILDVALSWKRAKTPEAVPLMAAVLRDAATMNARDALLECLNVTPPSVPTAASPPRSICAFLLATKSSKIESATLEVIASTLASSLATSPHLHAVTLPALAYILGTTDTTPAPETFTKRVASGMARAAQSLLSQSSATFLDSLSPNVSAPLFRDLSAASPLQAVEALSLATSSSVMAAARDVIPILPATSISSAQALCGVAALFIAVSAAPSSDPDEPLRLLQLWGALSDNVDISLFVSQSSAALLGGGTASEMERLAPLLLLRRIEPPLFKSISPALQRDLFDALLERLDTANKVASSSSEKGLCCEIMGRSFPFTLTHELFVNQALRAVLAAKAAPPPGDDSMALIFGVARAAMFVSCRYLPLAAAEDEAALRSTISLTLSLFRVEFSGDEGLQKLHAGCMDFLALAVEHSSVTSLQDVMPLQDVLPLLLLIAVKSKIPAAYCWEGEAEVSPYLRISAANAIAIATQRCSDVGVLKGLALAFLTAVFLKKNEEILLATDTIGATLSGVLLQTSVVLVTRTKGGVQGDFVPFAHFVGRTLAADSAREDSTRISAARLLVGLLAVASAQEPGQEGFGEEVVQSIVAMKLVGEEKSGVGEFCRTVCDQLDNNK